jgi:hypothetical protein
MIVRFITVSQGSDRQTFRMDTHDLSEVFRLYQEGHRWNRIAFGGMTSLGRSGIAVDFGNHIVVSGHKIDPIPSELLNLVEHFDDFSEAIKRLSEGGDVLIRGDDNNLILFKWNGHQSALEVFGLGNDNEAA